MLNNMSKEIWKAIPEYSGIYMVSSFGRIKSIDRTITNKNGFTKNQKGKVLKTYLTNSGYKQVSCYSLSGVSRHVYIHQAVAIAFLGYKKQKGIVCDHINRDRLDNRVENLRVITHRENLSKGYGTSKYIGVRLRLNKYIAEIRINGKKKSLGSFKTELEAHNAYQQKLKEITTKMKTD